MEIKQRWQNVGILRYHVGDGDSSERLGIAFSANGKREIQVEKFSK